MVGWNGPVRWMVALSILMFFVSIGLAWVIIVRMPEDYLTRSTRKESSFADRHPLVRMILLVAKNTVGLLFVAAGVVMLVTPGQGLLFIFIGITMLDIAGKRWLIRRMLNNRRVLHAINRIRRRAKQPPLAAMKHRD